MVTLLMGVCWTSRKQPLLRGDRMGAATAERLNEPFMLCLQHGEVCQAMSTTAAANLSGDEMVSVQI